MMMPVTLDDSILFTEKSLRQLYNNITNLKKEQSNFGFLMNNRRNREEKARITQRTR